MVTTFATPLVKAGSDVVSNAARINSKTFSEFFTSLWKNKGVQVGVGLGGAGLGLSVLGGAAKDATQPFSELSPFLLLGIVAVILILLLGGRRR